MTMISTKEFKEVEGAEYGVDSRYASKQDRLHDGKALMEARLQRMKTLSPDTAIKARLLQLKLKMEEFIKEPVYLKQNHFTTFLTSYIDTLYSKRMNFAQDIDIKPILLSQVINKHREPKEEFMLRLMIHSERVYSNICPFPEKTWYQVYFQEKLCEMMANQDEWRPEVERHVNTRNPIESN